MSKFEKDSTIWWCKSSYIAINNVNATLPFFQLFCWCYLFYYGLICIYSKNETVDIAILGFTPLANTQLTFTCSKSIIEILENEISKLATKVSNNKLQLVFLLLTFNIFHTFSIADLEQVNASWISSFSLAST